MSRDTHQIATSQRAVWMVLITSIAAPLFAALIHVAWGLSGPVFDGLVPLRVHQSVGEMAGAAFVWATLPATVAGLGLTPYVLQSGTYSWLQAAVAGVIACGLSVIVWPIDVGAAMPFLAFMAGLIAIAIRQMLIVGGILKT